jgi:RsiW-degrading membrane proteinase PrsW (M82 family)
LLLLIALASRLVRTAFDGFILGAFIGLGFQIFEDVLYALNSAASQFGADPVGAAMPTIILRMVFGVAAHTLYSAIFGAGLVYLLGRPAEPRRVGRGLALMATAMLLHGLWDSAGALTQGKNALLFPLFFVMVAAALTLVVRVFRMTVPRERQNSSLCAATTRHAGLSANLQADTRPVNAPNTSSKPRQTSPTLWQTPTEPTPAESNSLDPR